MTFYVSLIILIVLNGCGSAAQPTAAPTPTPAQVVTFQTATPDPAAAEAVNDPPQTTPLEDSALVEALQQGGYVIFFRHAATYRAQLDTDQQNLENCQTQRNINEEGIAQAEAIGQAFRAATIPLGEVLASPYCRTRDTAEIAFGQVTLSDDLINPFSKEDEAEVTRLGEQLQQLLSRPPAPGTNTVLVGHTPNLQAATGLSIIEGEAAIFAPTGPEGFTLVGRVLPDEWSALVEE